MSNNVLRKSLSLLAAVLFILGCSLASSGTKPQDSTSTSEPPTESLTEAPSTEASPTPTQSSSTTGTGPCANSYFPIREGATWSYQSAGSMAGPYSFTDTITAVRADGYTLTSQFKDLTRTQEWACDADGLKALQLGGGLSTQNMNLQIQTQNASGVTYPKEINTGDQWDYALDFTGTMDIGGNSGAATGKETVHFTAAGTESVTVPAGTFDAMKIEGVTTLNITVTYQGVTVPVAFTSTYTYWLVKDVGWVRAEGTGELSGQSFSETIELQSYNIP